MKTKLLSYCCALLLLPFISYSQCPNAPITLSSQAEVDAFTTNYPNCTNLLNLLEISGSDIVDLSPLPELYLKNISIHSNEILTSLDGLNINIVNEVQWSQSLLYITGNPILTDISALASTEVPSDESYAQIDGSVSNNPLLTSLNGLQFWTHSSFLVIDNNDALTNLSGLDNLSRVGDLWIRENDNLINLVGLSSIEVLYENFLLRNNSLLQSLNGFNPGYHFWEVDMFIDNNPSLIDISVMNSWTVTNVDQEYMRLHIFENQNLSICNNLTTCSMIEMLNEFQYLIIINNNNNGCNDIQQIEDSCNLLPDNDECDGAYTLTIGDIFEANNVNATTSVQTPSCNDVDRADVWFTFNSDSLTIVDIISEEGYNLQLWEGNCSALTQVSNACEENTLTDISVSSNTDYYVQVWSCASCRLATGVFDILVQDGTLSTQEEVFNGFSIYPNPTNSYLYLKAKNTITSIEIYNLLGQQMLSTTPNTLSEELDMSQFNSGMYLVKVKIGEQIATYKVVKE